jgi:hypothetical protein
LKDSSYFKQSTGDEAGSAPKKGIITSKIKGKVYFNSWSMDVKIEGENAVRHLDLTTHNHASKPGQTPPWPYLDSMGLPPDEKSCKKEQKREEEKCGGLVARRDTAKGKGKGAILKGQTKDNICADTPAANECRQAQKCKLTPQKEGCCPNSGQQAHHVVEAHGFYEAGTRKNLTADALPEFKGYQPGDAPCVCAQGGRAEAEHGAFHAMVGKRENNAVKAATKAGTDAGTAWTYKDAKKAGVRAHKKIFPNSKCSEECLEAQLDAYHKGVGANDGSLIRTETASLSEWQKASDNAVLESMQDHLAPATAGSIVG